MGDNREKVLLTATFLTTFIQQDIVLLEKLARVKCIIASGPTAILRIAWHALFCNVTFTWFASVHSFVVVFLARLLKKKAIICLGGVDAVSVPEIGYGIWLNRWKVPFVRYAVRNADTVLAVAPPMIARVKELADYPGDNLEYLPFGFDLAFWKPASEKESIVLTVGSCGDETRLLKKGIDFILSAARKMDKVGFLVVGIEEGLTARLGWSVPDNVTILPPARQERLRSHYQRALVYCQPSRSEGMPNTLCEAMACGCIPVGTDVDGIPAAIGETGFIVPLGDIEAMVQALKEALQLNASAGLEARKRIEEEFPIQRREMGLREAIKGRTGQ